MDFLDHWDTVIEANEKFFDKNPNIANFAFSEAAKVYNFMEEENLKLRTDLDKLNDEIAQRQDTENSLTKWVHELVAELDAVKGENERLKTGLQDIGKNIDIGMQENKQFRARIASLEKSAKLYLLALELYLPSAVGVMGRSDAAEALRSVEKDLRHALGE